MILGAWGLRSAVVSRRSSASSSGAADKTLAMAAKTDRDSNQIISWGESLSLGFALSLNCIATGLGAGASGVSPALTAISVGLFSLLSVDAGIRFGNRMAKSWLGSYADLLGCILLIAIGCYEVIL